MKPDKKILGKWVVIRYYTGANPDLSIPAPASLVKFSKIDPTKFYWNGSSSYCVIDDSTELEEVIDPQPKTAKEEDKVYIYFMKKYHPISAERKLIQSGGWISPDGKFYPCDYGEHAGVGRCINAYVYGVDESWHWLRDYKGWLYLYKDGTTGYDAKTMPKGMLNKIIKLATVGDDKWKSKLKYLIERYR